MHCHELNYFQWYMSHVGNNNSSGILDFGVHNGQIEVALFLAWTDIAFVKAIFIFYQVSIRFLMFSTHKVGNEIILEINCSSPTWTYKWVG